LNLERRRPPADAEPRLPSTQQRFRPSPDDPAPGEPPPSHPSTGHPSTGHPSAADLGHPHAAVPPGSHAAASPASPLVSEELERLRLERLRRYASGVELAETSDDEQPFRRCALCETDSNRAATRCQNCGADLTTDQQRDFNARLWTHRREELAREKEELARLHGPHGPSEGQSGAEGTRALGQALARHVAIEERARLSYLEDPPVGGLWWKPPGWRLLGLIEPDWLRYSAVAGILGFTYLLISLALDEFNSGVAFGVPQAFLLALVILFLPTGRWRGGSYGGWWWWR
jgi:hypothetical protein